MDSTILVIENNKEIAESVSELLRLEGYTVFAATSGRNGIALVNQQQPDLILCDVSVPEIDGYGVLHILSKDPATAKIPFIFLAAKVDMEDFRKGMNLGADDYILKPFDSTDLLSAIEMRLRKYKFTRNSFDAEHQDFQDWHGRGEQPKGLTHLLENSLRRLYKKKEFLFTAGEPQHYLYFISQGEVKVSSTNESGKEIIFKLIRAKQFCGYKSLLNGLIHIEDGQALMPTEVKLIKSQDFLQLVYCNREVAKWLINCLAHDLIHTERRLIELAYQSVRQKVAAALIQIYEDQNVVSKGNLLITLSRRDLAAMVGTAQESLNRTILEFRKEGIVEITPKGIQILKMNKLERIFCR